MKRSAFITLVCEEDCFLPGVLYTQMRYIGTLKGGVETILSSSKPIKLLYLLGADDGVISKRDLDKEAFVVYQGKSFSIRLCGNGTSREIYTDMTDTSRTPPFLCVVNSKGLDEIRGI